MIDYFSLLAETSAYKIIAEEKKLNKLSHAYLFISADEESIFEYLKIFAKLFACNAQEICGSCRDCLLIEKGIHPDVIFYGKNRADKVLVGDIKDLISQTYVKPLESDKKIFVINNFDLIDEKAQNKLLKTLEEPPFGMYFLLGASADASILQTVKSRVKKIELSCYNDQQLFEALKEDCPDYDKLRQVISAGDGTIGRAVNLYGSECFFESANFVKDLVKNMQSSKDALEFSVKLSNLKCGIEEFISTAEIFFSDMLKYYELGENGVKVKEWLKDIVEAKGFNCGATLYIIDVLEKAKKRLKANANQTMLIDWLLFKILEGKYKWQKL